MASAIRRTGGTIVPVESIRFVRSLYRAMTMLQQTPHLDDMVDIVSGHMAGE